jgi:hypothetical protein
MDNSLSVENMESTVGEKLVKALKTPQESDSQESLAKAMEITKAYASSGAATHFSAIARLFFDLFEMFETGKDPRQK